MGLFSPPQTVRHLQPVRVHERRIGENLIGRPVRDQPAAFQQQHAPARLAEQLQVVWFKEVIRTVLLTGNPFPDNALLATDQCRMALETLKSKYPNVRLVLCSSRNYGGFATTGLGLFGPDPGRPALRRQKKSRECGSLEFNREASNEVARPLGKNPDDWMATVNGRKA